MKDWARQRGFSDRQIALEWWALLDYVATPNPKTGKLEVVTNWPARWRTWWKTTKQIPSGGALYEPTAAAMLEVFDAIIAKEFGGSIAKLLAESFRDRLLERFYDDSGTIYLLGCALAGLLIALLVGHQAQTRASTPLPAQVAPPVEPQPITLEGAMLGLRRHGVKPVLLPQETPHEAGRAGHCHHLAAVSALRMRPEGLVSLLPILQVLKGPSMTDSVTIENSGYAGIMLHQIRPGECEARSMSVPALDKDREPSITEAVGETRRRAMEMVARSVRVESIAEPDQVETMALMLVQEEMLQSADKGDSELGAYTALCLTRMTGHHYFVVEGRRIEESGNWQVIGFQAFATKDFEEGEAKVNATLDEIMNGHHAPAPRRRSKKTTREDLENTVMPARALWAVTWLSALLGQEITTYQPDSVAWSLPDEEGYFCTLSWARKKLELEWLCNPGESDAYQKFMYPIIGYCAYHGIKVEHL